MGSEELERDAVIKWVLPTGDKFLWVSGGCNDCALNDLHDQCDEHPNRQPDGDKACPSGYCWIPDTPEAIAEHIARRMDGGT